MNSIFHKKEFTSDEIEASSQQMSVVADAISVCLLCLFIIVDTTYMTNIIYDVILVSLFISALINIITIILGASIMIEKYIKIEKKIVLFEIQKTCFSITIWIIILCIGMYITQCV